MKLHTEIFPEEQIQVFNILCEQDWLSRFYLAGGTCLGLQLGHRQSIDFDFFTREPFAPTEIIRILRNLGKFELFNQTDDTLNGAINDVRISFFRYDYPLLEETTSYKSIQLANLLDIALMKIAAISGRGSRKDFVDLFFLLSYFPLEELLRKYPPKYGLEISNHYHLLKSLVYFVDAEKEPLPKMLKAITWEKIRGRFITEIRELQREKILHG